jgi:hypothetical protein
MENKKVPSFEEFIVEKLTTTTAITLDTFKKDYIGKQITGAAYLNKTGELVLSTPTQNIVFACAGKKGQIEIGIDGGKLEEIKKTIISQIEFSSLYELIIVFANGKFLEIYDGNFEEGIKVYVN